MEYLTIQQAAERTGRRSESITRACRRKTLKATWIGRQWLIAPDDLEEYINNPPKPGRKPKPPPAKDPSPAKPKVTLDSRSRIAMKDKRPKDPGGEKELDY